MYRREQRTRSTLLHLFCRNREDVQHFDHYLHDYVSHCGCRRHCDMRFEALEEVLDAPEEIDESLFARFNILGCLLQMSV